MDSDQVLLDGCLAGQPGAWEAFVARFAPLLASACRRALRRSGRPAGSQEAADMLQAVFLELLARDARILRAYRGQGSLTAYLTAVAVRKVFADRSLSRRGTPDPVPLEERPATSPGPPEVLETKETGARVSAALEGLPSRQRLALTLQAEGASLKEVGGALGISEDAAAQLLSRGREAMRERLPPP